MTLLRAELGRITFDVGSRVHEYMHNSPSPTPNKYEKLHNLDFIPFSKLIFINWKKITGHRVILTIFDSDHVIPYGIFNDNCHNNCVHLCSMVYCTIDKHCCTVSYMYSGRKRNLDTSKTKEKIYG